MKIESQIQTYKLINSKEKEDVITDLDYFLPPVGLRVGGDSFLRIVPHWLNSKQNQVSASKNKRCGMGGGI